MTDRRYLTVADMLRGMGVESDIIKSVEEAAESRKVISDLMARRAAKGLTQGDIASAIGCSQSRISKFESSDDADIRVGDFADYARALECDFLACAVPKAMTAADKVKLHARSIHKHLNDMLGLANEDPQIAAGVSQFMAEAFLNLTAIVGQSIRRLPRKPDGTPYCEIELDVDFVDAAEHDAPESDCECRDGPALQSV